ncbi:Retrovirus-related Pol polyprotein from transposon TNT 1-94 [Eumeta japonica]|uniref:Retrovirus-related Pol polyprotein from transposon TNT 1-94 n=1 Tax=Eumeta variegata TaxID=151549 RepID=A0A4C1UXV8_EUMVA|nr:Retrovirus-related Pol polyprotein from transposon TNT 1-94 [Eumeta japonica]
MPSIVNSQRNKQQAKQKGSSFVAAFSATIKESTSDQRFIDSSAAMHMMGRNDWIYNVTNPSFENIKVANRELLAVKGVCSQHLHVSSANGHLNISDVKKLPGCTEGVTLTQGQCNVTCTHYIEDFKLKVENELNHKMKPIHTDNGKEYCNYNFEKFLANHSTIHQTSLYTPQFGMAKKMKQTMVGRAKCMLYCADLEKKLWAEALATAACVVNRFPTKSLEASALIMFSKDSDNQEGNTEDSNGAQAMEEIYSPVVRYTTIRYSLALVARYGLAIDRMNALSVFLQGKINRDIYMQQPEKYKQGSQRQLPCSIQDRYVMASMNALKAEYGFDHLEWNFFAASHGKGAVDGISGSVKRSVWIVVKSRKAIVNSALEFYNLAVSLRTSPLNL